MFEDPEDLPKPDTILPARNFLLLQTDLVSQLKQASAVTPVLSGTPYRQKRGFFREEIESLSLSHKMFE